MSRRGLRRRVELEGAGEGVTVDIRTKAADVATSIVDDVKGPGADGIVSLLVPDDITSAKLRSVVAPFGAGVACAQVLMIVGG